MRIVTVNQLRTLLEIVNSGFSVSMAAHNLFLSQSALSTHLKILEEELAGPLFSRNGKKLVGLTPKGREAFGIASAIVSQMGRLRRLCDDYDDEKTGTLTVGTTFSQANKVLPRIIREFAQEYPNVSLVVKQNTPREVLQLLRNREVDLAISTGVAVDYQNIVTFLCYTWDLGLVVPRDHALVGLEQVTLDDLIPYKIVTYDNSVETYFAVVRAFRTKMLVPGIAMTGTDPHTIKNYVRLGFGVGVLGSGAIDPKEDGDLCFINAVHIFGSGSFCASLFQDEYVKGYMLRFIELYAPHWSRDALRAALMPSATPLRMPSVLATVLPQGGVRLQDAG